MSTHEPTPTSPDDQEPLSDLFSDVLRLANQVAARISQDEVEARLRRVLRRSGHSPAGADSGPLTVPFDPAEAENACRAVLSGQSLTEPLAAQLREMQQAVARMRHELMAMTVETRRTLHLANTARAQAEEARANAMMAHTDAARVMSEAREYHDAALERAASIVRDAKAAAEDIVQCAREAAAQRADARAEAWHPLSRPAAVAATSWAACAQTAAHRIWQVRIWDAVSPASADASPGGNWLSRFLLLSETLLGHVTVQAPEPAHGVSGRPGILTLWASRERRRREDGDLIQCIKCSNSGFTVVMNCPERTADYGSENRVSGLHSVGTSQWQRLYMQSRSRLSLPALESFSPRVPSL